MSKTFTEVLNHALTNPNKHEAVNWNHSEDSFTLIFLEQNIKQMWTDTEYVPSKDKKIWEKLSPEFQTAYKHALGGLTLLDTQQSTVGMPKIADHVEGLQRKAVLSFMGMMEAIHAKSYSTIFTTLIDDSQEIDEVFEWVKENQFLQYKADVITYYYNNINSKKDLYLAMVASVFLESFLFYSGFFLPLWLSGGGLDGKSKMVASGEIINKIIQDESIHGVYIGRLASELFEELTPKEQEMVEYETKALLQELMENEVKYTEELYIPIGLDHEVKKFLIYNANKAMMNLGLEPFYEEVKINSIVQNGLSLETNTHDFFSVKSTGYIKAKHRALTEADFEFEMDSEFD